MEQFTNSATNLILVSQPPAQLLSIGLGLGLGKQQGAYSDPPLCPPGSRKYIYYVKDTLLAPGGRETALLLDIRRN